MFSDEEFREKVRETTRLMRERMSVDEQMRVAFVPLIIQAIIFEYSKNLTDYARDNQLPWFKKYSRSIKSLKEDRLREMRKDLDSRHMRKIEEETVNFMAECGGSMTILYFTFNNEFKKRYPDVRHDILYTFAFMTLSLIDFLHYYVRKMDVLVRERIGERSDSVLPVEIRRMRVVLEEVTAGMDIDLDGHIGTGFKVFENHLCKIKFNLV